MIQDRYLHGMFEEQAKRAPDAIAVVCGERRYTYAELDAHANNIAHHLRALGAAPDVFIGICMARSLELVCGILGILKAGAAYVPLDPAYPSERLSLLRGDSGANVVLTDGSLPSTVVAGTKTRVVTLAEVPVSSDRASPAIGASPADAAYVIYTSGSTGVPKGVVVEHRQVTRLFTSTQHWFRFGRHDVWTMFHSHGFDFSVWEMWGALLYGGTLVIVPSATSRDPDAFYDLLLRERVTVLNQTPSAFYQLSRALEARRKPSDLALRWIIFGGEALDTKMLRGWFERYGDRRPELVNMYGITETTVHVTYRPLTRADVDGGARSPIGVPIPDLSVYLLDEHERRVPKGTVGEIYVGGAGVARGYLNRPDLNEERFLADPFRGEPGARMYRSGDLAIECENGELDYVGRADAQLKIRGFRVEPGEVESCMRRCSGVSDVAVVARDYGEGDRKLVAYVVPQAAHHAVEAALLHDLRALVAEHLPEHMRPSAYVVLESLPLNAHGKLARSALPAPESANAADAESTRLPSTSTEKALAVLWKQVLGKTAAHLDDDFFDVGGTSLGAIKLILLIQEQMGCALEMSVWTHSSTLGELAAIVSKQANPAPERLTA